MTFLVCPVCVAQTVCQVVAARSLFSHLFAVLDYALNFDSKSSIEHTPSNILELLSDKTYMETGWYMSGFSSCCSLVARRVKSLQFHHGADKHQLFQFMNC
jgi:hypothetical protein